jgi:hypothetical protein
MKKRDYGDATCHGGKASRTRPSEHVPTTDHQIGSSPDFGFDSSDGYHTPSRDSGYHLGKVDSNFSEFGAAQGKEQVPVNSAYDGSHNGHDAADSSPYNKDVGHEPGYDSSYAAAGGPNHYEPWHSTTATGIFAPSSTDTYTNEPILDPTLCNCIASTITHTRLELGPILTEIMTTFVVKTASTSRYTTTTTVTGTATITPTTSVTESTTIIARTITTTTVATTTTTTSISTAPMAATATAPDGTTYTGSAPVSTDLMLPVPSFLLKYLRL